MRSWYVITGMGIVTRRPKYLREDKGDWGWVYDIRRATLYAEPPVGHRFVCCTSGHPKDRKIIEVSEDDLLVEDLLAQL